MGQRLVVHVIDEDHQDYEEPLAAIYYHWSDFTNAAYQELRTLLTYLRTYNDPDPIARLVKGVTAHGGIIDRMDIEKVKSDPELEQKFGYVAINAEGDRNHGIVSLTPESVAQSIQWEEGRAILDVSAQTCDVESYYPYQEAEELMECEEMDQEEFDEELFDMPVDPYGMTLEDVNEAIRCLDAHGRQRVMHFPSGEYGVAYDG